MLSKKIQIAVFLILAGALLIIAYPVYAGDNLYLTGVVKSVDHISKTVIIDVKSSACRGLRTFVADNTSDLEDFVDQKIVFYIDSTTCKKNKEYRMLPGAEVKK